MPRKPDKTFIVGHRKMTVEQLEEFVANAADKYRIGLFSYLATYCEANSEEGYLKLVSPKRRSPAAGDKSN